MSADLFDRVVERAECTREPLRDPRKDPQPGDILRVRGDQREVVDRMQDRIEYGFPNRAASRWIALWQWQAWARTAEVVKVSP